MVKVVYSRSTLYRELPAVRVKIHTYYIFNEKYSITLAIGILKPNGKFRNPLKYFLYRSNEMMIRVENMIEDNDTISGETKELTNKEKGWIKRIVKEVRFFDLTDRDKVQMILDEL